jgi:tRNA 2-(methylsulfanyl)-N6-isopentenyladenosine37 hydroxylase
MHTDLLAPIMDFLPCQTPAAWIEAALVNQEILLIDHANCEKKAAATAMNLMYKYVQYPDLLCKMSHLAREELLHFEQVVALMTARGIEYRQIGPARYAAGLRAAVRPHEPARLVDILVIGAFVEARSCERFAALIPFLDPSLAKFYSSLLKSEARHFQDYLTLARDCAGKHDDVAARVAFFATLEADLITSPRPGISFPQRTDPA